LQPAVKPISTPRRRRSTVRKHARGFQQRREVIGAVAIIGAVTFVALMLALVSNC
jgi:hypothetical protein